MNTWETKGTIEENMRRLQEKKQEPAGEISGGEGLKNEGFSREALMKILQ